MNDLYCKDFEFRDERGQKAYDNLKQTILKRSRLDLEFLQRFIQFSSNAFCSTQFVCVRSSGVYAKDDTRIGAIEFYANYLGLSERTIQKLYLTYERFIIEESFADVGASTEKTFSWILPEFRDMTLSKLFELLSISIDDLSNAFDRNDINPNMTVKQLREWVKAFKSTKNSNKLEEAIDKDDEEQQAPTPDFAERHETYDAIVAYINLFNGMDFAEAKPDELKDIVVANLHCVKNLLVKEFGLKISTTKKRLKVVK